MTRNTFGQRDLHEFAPMRNSVDIGIRTLEGPMDSKINTAATAIRKATAWVALGGTLALAGCGGGGNESGSGTPTTTTPGTSTLSVTSLLSHAALGSANINAVTLAGHCDSGATGVEITGAVTASAACVGTDWSTQVNLSAVADGVISLTLTQTMASSGLPAASITVSLTKDTAAPSVPFSLPATNSTIDPSTVNAVAVAGTCTENGNPVSLSANAGAVTATPPCASGAWSATLDLSALPDGAVSLTASQTDTAGNVGTTTLALVKTSVVSHTLADRTAAASATANNNPLCKAIAPFHWSLGDDTGRLAEGAVDSAASSVHYDALTTMNIASASKLLYGAWVAEQRAGVLTAEDVKYLNFSSGYTQFNNCLRGQTVAQCQSYLTNGDYVAANDGKFFYNSGHMQKHATLMGLGPDANAALAAKISGALGNIGITYSQPQLAGGVVSSATEYGLFLQRTVAGHTKIASLLGSHPVCTNPLTCATAIYTPIPTTESWHYSVGHWVEDDPVVGDGAFSSPGAFGFYPWISADKRWWGIVARHQTGGAIDSMKCGREIRAAWVSATAR